MSEPTKLDQALIDQLQQHSDELTKQRKEMKAPDAYPKKAALGKFSRGKSHNLDEFKEMQ